MVEILLQSYEGEIELLPAIQKVWASGSDSGLCARGVFEINLSWVNGELAIADLKSKTNTNVTILLGGKTVGYAMKKGETIIRNNYLEKLCNE